MGHVHMGEGASRTEMQGRAQPWMKGGNAWRGRVQTGAMAEASDG